MHTKLRTPVGPEGDQGSGPDNTGNLMDNWSDSQGQNQPGQQPAPVQVTPPLRPQRQAPISDNPPAQQTQETQQAQQQAPAQQQQATPSLSEADLTRIATVAAGAVRQSQPQQQRVEQPPMSDEQFAARYRTPQANAATMRAILDPDPVKGAVALNALLKQTYTSALLMANDLHQAEMTKVRGEFAPHIDTFRAFQVEQQKQRLENEFYSLNPDLANEKILVEETRDSFEARVNRGEVHFTDKTQAFKAVADNVRKILARMGPAQTNGGQQTQSQQTSPSPAQRTMASATSQGRSGSGQPPNGSSMDKMMTSWDQ